MPGRILTALTLTIATAACAAPSPNAEFEREVAELAAMKPAGCGVRGAMGIGATARAQPGDAVRACALPTAEDVERACEVHEAVPNYTRRDPNDPDEYSYDFPEYTVDALNCTFVDEHNSGATCAFELATPTSQHKIVELEFTHKLGTHITPLTFEYYTTWGSSRSCLPGAASELAN